MGGTTSFDVISSLGTLTYGGTLALTNSGTMAWSDGDSLQVFKATTYAGSFSSISPATPGEGLVWDLSALNTKGMIRVKSDLTALSAAKSLEIEIAPNPVKETLRILWNIQSENAYVRIYALNGVLLLEQRIIGNQLNIPMNAFKSGMYVVKFESSKGVVLRRIIKS